MTTSLLRLPAALSMSGLTRSTHYLRIKQGLLTPPVKLGERCAAWPLTELSQINAARIAGKTESEIRTLVTSLLQQRTISAD